VQVSRPSAKGQVTIPKETGEILGLKPGDMGVYEVQNGVTTLRRAEPFKVRKCEP